jgi:DNA-binding transcriptional MocR family regulator
MPQTHLATVVGSVDDRSPAGIATAVGRLVSDGTLPAESRLPTVRSLARELDVSPSTVTDAWRRLQHAGLVVTDGRRGSFVRARRRPDEPERFWQVPVDPDAYRLDLSLGTPDPRLLPPIGSALTGQHDDDPVTSYLADPTIPELTRLLHGTWPFPPGALTVVDGAMDALDRLIAETVTFGDRVVVEDPGFPPALDMLDLAGAEMLPVPMVEGGPDTDAFAAALARRPVAVLLQPRAHNPTGWNLSPGRADRLAELLDGTGILVIEDDHSGDVSGVPLESLGTRLPDQVVHVRSYSKGYGPDLRLAAVGGRRDVIDRLVHRRQLGPGWSSRLLQRVLLHLLEDPVVATSVAQAAEAYRHRRTTLVDLLADRGIRVPGVSGFNLWMEVADETTALVSLAAQGIGAAPGSPFRVAPDDRHHLRLTISAVNRDFAALADTLADASRAPGRRRGRA